jgi:hypothetical protein
MNDSQTNINKALILYIGYGITSYPKEDNARLVAEFGPELAPVLEIQVKSLLEELDQIKPDWNTHTLISAAKSAADELRRRHSELNEQSSKALEWIFSWWWK